MAQVVSLPFGSGSVQVELPDDAIVIGGGGGEGRPRLQPAPDQERAVREALANPLGMPRLGELARPGARVLIAFDDCTVASFGPLRRLAIEAMVEELTAAGVREEDIHLVCANALHRKWRREELASVLGEALIERFGPRLTCHDAEAPEDLVYLGTSESGYDVEVHRLVAEADITCYVNAGYHLGFNGGWKSIVVGLSTWRSIRWTHTPDGMSMSVHDNRMHRVLTEMGHHLRRRVGKPIFKVETVLANPYQVARVFAGDVDETRRAAIEVMASLFPPRRAEAPTKADILVYGVPAWSPYASFARMNPILTLVSSGLGYLGGYIEALGKPGCSVVMATPCPEEWDMVHHPAYKEVWDRVLPATRDPYEIMARFEGEFASHRGYIEAYRFGYAYHPVHALLATHPLKRLRHAGRVFVAGAEDPAVPRHLGFIPTRTVEEAIAEARRLHGPDATVACVARFPGT